MSKPLVYCNIAALAVNASIVWLTVAKTFPMLLGVVLAIGFIAGATWFSCYLHEVLPCQRRRAFHSAPTEKVEIP